MDIELNDEIPKRYYDKIQQVFGLDPEYNKQQEILFKKMRENAINRKACYTCAKAYFKPHYEHGHYGGDDPYCSMNDSLRFGLDGDQCLFYELSEEYKNV